MCFSFKLTTSKETIEKFFDATFVEPNVFQPAIFNGFQFPLTPVILNIAPKVIHFAEWGLIPPWAKNESIRTHTLNARIETIHEKPSFRESINNRCLVLADGFYEWQWIDSQGKRKQKYLLALPNNEPFGLAGLWSQWRTSTTGKTRITYTLLTTEANELLSRIHNTKKRMPLILNPTLGKSWLRGEELVLENGYLIGVAIK
ncbi:MAG: SOS response-associated peptidase [Bacteroidetes bacterium]|nr:SOS response-associated peptidase [Bacteroidota bacterium]